MQSPIELLEQSFADLPTRIEPSVKMKEPNELLEIYSGTFEIVSNEQRATIAGSIRFRWYPSANASFAGEVQDDPSGLLKDFNGKALSLFVDGLKAGDAHINRRILGGNQIIHGVCVGTILGDSSVAVQEVLFSLPNFRDFLGKTVRIPDQSSSYAGRLEFDDGEYMVTLDMSQDYKNLHEALSQSGGYLVLYGGKITRHKGAINSKDLREFLLKLNTFISFINGRRIGVQFLKGMHEGETIWTDYAAYYCDDYKPVPAWSNALSIHDFNDIWQAFSKLWEIPENKHFLSLAVHWYIESNSGSGFVDGSIIMVQTGLELLYNWLIVEQRKIILGGDATGISASNKIRLLLSQINIGPAVPDALGSLKGISGDMDGPEILVWIRNCLVHGQRQKRDELAKLTIWVRNDALQLGLWYSELVILYILGYTGKYDNRTTADKWRDLGENVPWVLK